MKRMKTMLFAAVAAVTMGAWAYAPAKSPLMTEWGENISPENAWREYPRPQMVRDNWVNLNGEWDYAITSVTNTPLLREMVDEFHANGIKVASIPFQGGEREETYFKLHELGFDGFSTDYPSVMFKVIKDLKGRK